MLSLDGKRRALRSRLLQDGFFVNDGLKYGLDLLVYTDHPDRVHSKYGAVVYDNMTYQQLVMHQRMCCTVNKILIVAFVDEDARIELVQCDRFATRAREQDEGGTQPGLGLTVLSLD